MKRLRIPALVDLLQVSDPGLIANLADDARLDREYASRGPLFNRIVTGRIRKVLSLNGKAAAVGRAARKSTANAGAGGVGSPARSRSPRRSGRAIHPFQALARYVRGEGPGAAAGPLAQEAVGRLFAPEFEGDAESSGRRPGARSGAADVQSFSPSPMGPDRRGRHRPKRLLSDKVGHESSGVHGVGVAVHNFPPAFSRMRALWADPATRAHLTAGGRRGAMSRRAAAGRPAADQGWRVARGRVGRDTCPLATQRGQCPRAEPRDGVHDWDLGALPGARVGSSVAGGGVARGAGVSAWITIRSSPRSSSAT